MGKVMAVNISVKRGTQKVNVHTVKLIENYGLENDAHAGNWHRQVSLLSYEKIEEFKEPTGPGWSFRRWSIRKKQRSRRI